MRTQNIQDSKRKMRNKFYDAVILKFQVKQALTVEYPQISSFQAVGFHLYKKSIARYNNLSNNFTIASV